MGWFISAMRPARLTDLVNSSVYHRNVNPFRNFLCFALYRRLAAALIAVVLLSGIGCRREAATGRRKNYPMRGVVVSTDYPKAEVVVNQEAIPGLMGAMTMTYPLPNPGVLSDVHPGDEIKARLWAASDDAGGTKLRLDRVEVASRARPDEVSAIQYHVPVTGDVVPDFPLLNQDGRVIRLSDFKGKAVMVTFIHTRCDIAIYCPRVSEKFAEIEKSLAADPAVYAKTHLITISFDPAYDTPQVLRSYGAKYLGAATPGAFAHLDFAAPAPADLLKMEQFFNLRVSGKGAALVHSLATVTIGKDGKVVGCSPTSDWPTSALLTQFRSVANQ
jgi:protein SCO1/2